MTYKRKTYYHECKICGANLDPGEGEICDECKAEMNSNKENENRKSTKDSDSE